MKRKSQTDRLAQDLCNDGRVIEAAWTMLSASTPQPPGVTLREVEALKTCYFLGADFVMQVLVTAAHEGWSHDDIDRQMAKILKELRNFLLARAREASQELNANLH